MDRVTRERAWLAAPVVIGEDRGRQALIVGGVVQSVAPEAAESGYWSRMVPDHQPARGLLLGYGAGTVARLIVQRFGPTRLVGVDDDQRVTGVARLAFGAPPAGVQLVLADAIQFVQGCAGRFDYIAVDLFHGGDPPRGVTGRPFLHSLRAALTPKGRVVFNLFRDSRLERREAAIGGALSVEHVLRVRDNAVLWCRR